MIEFMDESDGNMLGVRATGKLVRANYRDVLAPRIRLLVKQFRTLRVLFLMDENFAGWSIAAACANTVFDVRHRRNIAKIAMVGAPAWEEWCIRKAAALLITGDIRTFRTNELARAWEWLRD